MGSAVTEKEVERQTALTSEADKVKKDAFHDVASFL